MRSQDINTDGHQNLIVSRGYQCSEKPCFNFYRLHEVATRSPDIDLRARRLSQALGLPRKPSNISTHLSGNGDLNLNTGLDVDDDLLDDLGRGVKVDKTLVDSHLKGVPGLGTLTVRSLTGGDLEVLGRKADWALDAEVLGLCAVNELSADLLEGLDLARGEGDADLVDLGGIALGGLLGVLERHVVGWMGWDEGG